jgi:hypothetical protein
MRSRGTNERFPPALSTHSPAGASATSATTPRTTLDGVMGGPIVSAASGVILRPGSER